MKTMQQVQNHNYTLGNLHTNTPAPPLLTPPPSQMMRRRYETISLQVRTLVYNVIVGEGRMGWKEAKRTFHVSHSSIGRILREEKQRAQEQDPNNNNPPQQPKRKGRTSNNP
eukprot:TRINITY_DN14190_c0_g1_i1.p1 TRINITY_DN14190_c0_g1~~TRINITY_DN14190_c0_g1_i1.p1  ORF type:complete len:112 (+),score=40.15 TRINITY_DN14190_c0_g1_i1:392-727(+)